MELPLIPPMSLMCPCRKHAVQVRKHRRLWERGVQRPAERSPLAPRSSALHETGKSRNAASSWAGWRRVGAPPAASEVRVLCLSFRRHQIWDGILRVCNSCSVRNGPEGFRCRFSPAPFSLEGQPDPDPPGKVLWFLNVAVRTRRKLWHSRFRVSELPVIFFVLH